MSKNFKQLLSGVKCFIFDIDGVLTDGKLMVLQDGELIRTMNVRDGYAMQLAIKKGYKIAVISGGKSEYSKRRLNLLGITDVYVAVSDKIEKYEEVLELYGLNENEILYMGDDMPDLAVLKRVGVPTCPNDAANEIKNACIYVSPRKGGDGCVRDVIEQVLKLHQAWE